MVRPVHLPISFRPFAEVQRIEVLSGGLRGGKEGPRVAVCPKSELSRPSDGLVTVSAFGYDATPARSELWLQRRALKRHWGYSGSGSSSQRSEPYKTYIYIYIYIYRCMYVYVCVYIYIYIYKVFADAQTPVNAED